MPLCAKRAAPQTSANCAAGRGYSVAFIGSKCLFDDASGISHSIRSILELLAEYGVRASSLSASVFDATYEVNFRERAALTAGQIVEKDNGLILVSRNNVRHFVLATASSQKQNFSRSESDLLLRRCKSFLRAERPDIVITYGSGSHARRLHSAIRAFGAKIVFYLGNAEIRGRDWFDAKDNAIAPSRFLADLYGRQLGSTVSVVFPIISPDRIAKDSTLLTTPAHPNRGYITHLNPTPQKGLTLLIALVQRAAVERPNMRFLVLGGIINKATLRQASVDLTAFPNIEFEYVVHDMAALYARTSVLLMPSFWREGFGRGAVEAQLSGVPVLASNRGGLPEAMNNVRCTLSVPKACIENPMMFPDEKTVGHWWTALKNLWDDLAAYEIASQRALTSAEAYKPKRTKEVALAIFDAIAASH